MCVCAHNSVADCWYIFYAVDLHKETFPKKCYDCARLADLGVTLWEFFAEEF